MYLFVSMFDSATALLFLFIYLHLDTVSLYVKRMINTSTEKKCSDQRSFVRHLSTSSPEVFSFGDPHTVPCG